MLSAVEGKPATNAEAKTGGSGEEEDDIYGDIAGQS